MRSRGGEAAAAETAPRRAGGTVPPTVHLICNAHLDPVWQWRWEEGAAEAVATFRTAARLLGEHPRLIFNHNEALLYRWVERLDPDLFREIKRLADAGRWVVAGGWHLQPDVNLPGAESLVRQVVEGRRYFREKFGARPVVAYNFDSFGHGGGLPQILRSAGYEMYVHMRPDAADLPLPADLYRWRGVDGSEVLAHRISVGLYHTERDNVGERVRAGIARALELGRDVAVFWGLGDHGGGPTREDLATIDAIAGEEARVRVEHSTPDRFYAAVRGEASRAPVVEGGLQRCFTGCYTSLSRLKRESVRSLGLLVQAETAASAAWWLREDPFPESRWGEAWRCHLFNDFHDVITGSCIEAAERDALAYYGRAAVAARRLRLRAVAALNRGEGDAPPLPVTVFNGDPSAGRVPVEVELMADYRPFWKGKWRLRLFAENGDEVPCQEEQAEALLPFNAWRRRLCFFGEWAGAGVRRYEVRAEPVGGPGAAGAKPSSGETPERAAAAEVKADAGIKVHLDPNSGFVTSLRAPGGPECLAGPLFEPLAVTDTADAWGTGTGAYRAVAGRFKLAGRPSVVARGSVRTGTRSVFEWKRSRVVLDVYSYPSWPVLEARVRVRWNEERMRLKLVVATPFDAPEILGEIPAGATRFEADGQEHVHGRWLMIEGRAAGARGKAVALGIASSGQHGFDALGGEVRLSVLRSNAYCHERGFDLAAVQAPRFADIGEHEFRLFVTAGTPLAVRQDLPALADLLAAPPFALAHLPFAGDAAKRRAPAFLHVDVPNVRLMACHPAPDGTALAVRLREASGIETRARLRGAARSSGAGPEIALAFRPFEIKTLRLEPSGTWSETDLLEDRR